jgi:hypothetical protein
MPESYGYGNTRAILCKIRSLPYYPGFITDFLKTHTPVNPATPCGAPLDVIDFAVKGF